MRHDCGPELHPETNAAARVPGPREYVLRSPGLVCGLGSMLHPSAPCGGVCKERKRDIISGTHWVPAAHTFLDTKRAWSHPGSFLHTGEPCPCQDGVVLAGPGPSPASRSTLHHSLVPPVIQQTFVDTYCVPDGVLGVNTAVSRTHTTCPQGASSQSGSRERRGCCE